VLAEKHGNQDRFSKVNNICEQISQNISKSAPLPDQSSYPGIGDESSQPERAQ